jgi:hypothetical protein
MGKKTKKNQKVEDEEAEDKDQIVEEKPKRG